MSNDNPLMGCGHPESDAFISDEGTGFCLECARHATSDTEEEWDHPAFPTREAFDARTNELVAEESSNDLEWYYLSFALPKEEGGFLGGLYIRSNGIMTATVTASMLGLNPGGEVLSWGPISEADMDAQVPKEKRWRLLSRQEVNE